VSGRAHGGAGAQPTHDWFADITAARVQRQVEIERELVLAAVYNGIYGAGRANPQLGRQRDACRACSEEERWTVANRIGCTTRARSTDRALVSTHDCTNTPLS